MDVDGRQIDARGQPRPVNLRPLLGVWVNNDPCSTGIVRVEIDCWESVPTVRTFGAGLPTPIDWGEVAGIAFTDSIGGGHAVAFTADYDLDFVSVLLCGFLDQRRLVVDAYSVFADSSGRADYYRRHSFYLPCPRYLDER